MCRFNLVVLASFSGGSLMQIWRQNSLIGEQTSEQLLGHTHQTWCITLQKLVHFNRPKAQFSSFHIHLLHRTLVTYLARRTAHFTKDFLLVYSTFVKGLPLILIVLSSQHFLPKLQRNQCTRASPMNLNSQKIERIKNCPLGAHIND